MQKYCDDMIINEDFPSDDGFSENDSIPYQQPEGFSHHTFFHRLVCVGIFNIPELRDIKNRDDLNVEAQLSHAITLGIMFFSYLFKDYLTVYHGFSQSYFYNILNRFLEIVILRYVYIYGLYVFCRVGRRKPQYTSPLPDFSTLSRLVDYPLTLINLFYIPILAFAFRINRIIDFILIIVYVYLIVITFLVINFAIGHGYHVATRTIAYSLYVCFVIIGVVAFGPYFYGKLT